MLSKFIRQNFTLNKVKPKANYLNRITISQKVLSNNERDFTFMKLHFCTVIDISDTKNKKVLKNVVE